MTDIMSDSSGSGEYEEWISAFCSLFGHEYFVQVPLEYIEDDFNLTGLSSTIPYYREALDTILDLEPEQPIKRNQQSLIDHAAEQLYGLIHARYILTKAGLQAMAVKFDKKDFGVCQRYYCEGMQLLPCGMHDALGKETVRLYCPSCEDIYFPQSSRHLSMDGAFWGTSFPGLFVKTFKELDRFIDMRTKKQYELKIFGFKINDYATSGARMKWLRQKPNSEEDWKEHQECEFKVPVL